MISKAKTHNQGLMIRAFSDGYEKGRTDAIEEIMKKAETIQLEQIENLNKSTRRNGKMWARYMGTYLGHIQVACKRMLELKENK